MILTQTEVTNVFEGEAGGKNAGAGSFLICSIGRRRSLVPLRKRRKFRPQKVTCRANSRNTDPVALVGRAGGRGDPR